jgi:dCMP deaminase
MKPKLLQAYMQTAKIFAELSHARRLHVGAIVVKDDRIISIGYNGMPAGWDNNCEDESVEPYAGFEGSIHRIVLKTKPEVLHAESNSISKLARSSESGDGSVMFVTPAPCIDCAKLIFQSGIRQVFYGEEYRSRAGIDFLEKCHVEVKQVK